MLFYSLAILAILPVYTATAKKCPVISGVKNFNFEKWSQKSWLVTYVDNNDQMQFASGNRRFMMDSYNLLYRSTHDVQLIFESILDNQPAEDVFYGLLINPDVGYMEFRSTAYGGQTFPVTIFETDYESYSVSVSCVEVKEVAQISVTISTRNTKGVPNGIVTNVVKNLREVGIDVEFKKLSWESCSK